MIIIIMYILNLAYVAVVTLLKGIAFLLYALCFFEKNQKIMYFREKVFTKEEANGDSVGYVRYFKNGMDWLADKEMVELRKDYREKFEFPLK